MTLPTAKKRRLRLAAGGRHRIDVSERETIEASRLSRPLSGITEAVNAQLQTPEAWAAVWRDSK